MNILVLGAGVVGRTLVQELSAENYNITVVDNDPVALQEIQDIYDIKVINGHASHPDILELAGAEYADILIAATQNDEVNLLACQISKILFKIPTKIARIRYTSYSSYKRLNDRNSLENLAVDYFISPENEVKDYIHHLVQHPGVLQVEDFANDYVRLIVINVRKSKIIHGRSISELHLLMPKENFTRIVAISRGDQIIFPQSDTSIHLEDQIFLLSKTRDIQKILKILGLLDNQYKRIFISGGGHIGSGLASILEENYQVKIIDKSFRVTRTLAENLDSAIVLNGDITDQNIMAMEDMNEIDLFIAVTNSDETNALSSFMAKFFGARKTIALLNKPIYSDIMHNSTIDIAFSANHITSAQILRHIREGDTEVVHNLRRGAAEVMEIVVHGSENTCQIIGKKLSDIKLPKMATIGCLIRGKEVYFSGWDIVIEAEDHLIVFIFDKTQMPKLNLIFKHNTTKN